MRRYQPDRKKGKRCPVCSHPDRRAIDAQLWDLWGPARIARGYEGLTKRHICQHRDICIRRQLQAAFSEAGIVPSEVEGGRG